MRTISEIDFARILLRNTVLSGDDHTGYLDRLRNRVPEPKVRKSSNLQHVSKTQN